MNSFAIVMPLNMPLLQNLILHVPPHLYFRKIITPIQSVLVLQGGQELNSEEAGWGEVLTSGLDNFMGFAV